MMGNTAIEIRNLRFRYDTGPDVLKDVSLSVEQGELVALLGHNGSGKSTLVKHLNGLLRPEHGSVKILGSSTEDTRVSVLAADVALLFQNPEDQICKNTVREEAAFGPRNLGYPEDRVHALVSSALEAFDLLPMGKCNPHDLGGSERKRLALASVVAMDTGIVVLDEPTAGLDPGETAMLESVLRQLKSDGRTVLVITHDMDFVAENMGRAICLEQGRKRFDGDVADLFVRQRLLKQCGLLPPQVVQLTSCLELSSPCLTPEEFIGALLDNS